MTDLSTLAVRMADEVVHNVDGLVTIRQFLHRAPSGQSVGQTPLLAVYLDSATLRFVDTDPNARAVQTWHIEVLKPDVLGAEAGLGNSKAAEVIDTVEAISRLVVGWGDGIPDGEGGTFEEYAEPRRIVPTADGSTFRARLIVQVESLTW